ncbi:MAG: hypothetical protein P9M14_16515 [Candidatus Alcyoniella australis]|nr:hypothetical protein [Candidatus Alcyoniella australis]
MTDKNQAPIADETQIVAPGNDAKQAAVEKVMAAHRAAVSRIIEELPDDPDELKFRVRALAPMRVRIDFELGRTLLKLKSLVPYGEFTEFVADEVGLHYRAAGRAMLMAKRLNDHPRLLASYQENPKQGHILEVTEEELDEFDKSGQLLGRPADEFFSMTKAELMAEREKQTKAIKKLESKAKDKDTLIEALRGEIAKLRDGLSPAMAEAEEQLDVELKAFQAHFNLLRSIDPDNVENDVRGLVLGHYTRLTELVTEEYQDACERFHASGNPDLINIPTSPAE